MGVSQVQARSVLWVLFILLGSTPTWAESGKVKPFKRALVIAGGGTMTAAQLGVIAGAQKMGFVPDVIITTCGGSISASIFNAYRSSDQLAEFAMSYKHYNILKQVTINTPNVLSLQ